MNGSRIFHELFFKMKNGFMKMVLLDSSTDGQE